MDNLGHSGKFGKMGMSLPDHDHGYTECSKIFTSTFYIQSGLAQA